MSPRRSMDGIYAVPKPVSYRVKVHAITPPVRVLHTPKKRGVNIFRLTTFALVAAAAYLAAAPYIPNVVYYLNPPVAAQEIPTPTTTTLARIEPDTAAKYQYYGKNMLIIPKIGVESEILEGVDEKQLEQGLWRRPNTSTPELGSNTVIAAHRFSYKAGVSTFYHLDKLKTGDRFTLIWKGITYTYEVEGSRVVKAKEISVENPTEAPILTLYTCTPLTSSENRIVVVAKPVET